MAGEQVNEDQPKRTEEELFLDNQYEGYGDRSMYDQHPKARTPLDDEQAQLEISKNG